MATGKKKVREGVKKLSWDPVHRGDIYCSPACGGKCTWAAYQDAHAKAKALALLLGKGWGPRVWENLGWHWAAQTVDGLMKVHPSMCRDKTVSYTAFFGEGSGGQWAVHNDDPEEAVADALALAQKEAERISKLVETYQLTVSG